MSLERLYDKAKNANFNLVLEWEGPLGMPEPEDMTDEDVRKWVLEVPTIMPADSDRAVSTWLWRLEKMWGKLTLTHVDPAKRSRTRITKEKAKELYMDVTKGDMVVWNWRQINDHSVEMFREFFDERNKIYRESVIVDIDIYPDIRRRMKGKLR